MDKKNSKNNIFEKRHLEIRINQIDNIIIEIKNNIPKQNNL